MKKILAMLLAAALAVARAVAVLAPTLPCHTGSLAAGESRLLA